VQSASGPSDQSLLERIAGKDPGALADLYDRLAPAALALADRILRDRSEAEALLQEVFTRLWQEAGRRDASQGAPRTWLLSRIRDGAIDRLRRRDALQRAAAPEAAGGPAAHDAASEERERAAQAVAALHADQRQVLHLAFFEGLSQTRIAQRLGEPLAEVQSRLRLGMDKLRQALPGASS